MIWLKGTGQYMWKVGDILNIHHQYIITEHYAEADLPGISLPK